MTFSGRFVLNIIEFAAMGGANRQKMLELSGFSAEELCDEELRVSAEVYNSIIEKAEEATGDKRIGLHLGEQLNLSAAGLISQITQTSRTVKEALEYCCEFAGLGCRALSLKLIEEKEHFKLQLTPDPFWLKNSPKSVMHTIDGYIAFSLREFHTLTRQKYFPLAIHYALPKGEGAEECFRVFNCDVQFNQAEYAIFFDKSQINLPVVTSDFDLLRVLVNHATTKLASIQQQQGFYSTVKKSILNLVKPDFPSVAQVAANLNVSVRTLQRKLKEEGFTYKTLLEDLKKEFALGYLKDPKLSIKEIAYLLSYADSTAFIRSFKRWTGKSPQQYRQS